MSWNVTMEINLNDERAKEWGDIVDIYKKIRKNRSTGNTGEE